MHTTEFCMTVTVSSFGQIEQGVHYIGKSLIYSMRKAFLERAVVEFDDKSYQLNRSYD